MVFCVKRFPSQSVVPVVVADVWLLLITIVFAPPATLLLFRHADPRIGPWEDRPGIRESGEYLWVQFGRSWLIALATAPIVVLTAFNLDYYGNGESALSFLSPLWLVLLILAVTGMVVIHALAAMTDLPAKQAIIAGARVTGARLPAALLFLLLTAIIPVLAIIATYYILLPVAVMIPALVAIGFSTFVLKATRAPLPEPNQPTEERLHEKRSN